MVRAVIGFSLAPGAPALFLYIYGSVLAGKPDAIWSAAFLALTAYGVALCAGLPAYLLLRRRGLGSLRFYCASGAVVGALTGATLTAALFGADILEISVNEVWMKVWPVAMYGAGYGSLSSSLFWAIAVRR